MAPFACPHFRLSHMFAPPRGAPSLAAILLGALAALLWLLPAPAAAHGFMAEPAARNYKRNWQYCPHCVNFGGAWPSSGEGRLAWPRTAQPACGEPELMKAGEPVATYTEGEVIDISVFITAQHGGRHAFRLCTDSDAQEKCLSQHMLERADWSGPYSWTKTTGGSAPGAEVKKGSLGGQGGEQYTWRYRLPTGVSCTRCVLQWWWTTANSCRVPGAPAWVGSDPGMLSCTDRNTHPEEFRNCADITIKKRNRGSGGNSDDEADDSADKSAEAAKPAAAAAARPAVAAANPASPAGKPASPGPKPAGGLNAKTSNATVVPPQKPQQQQPQAGSPSLNSTQPAAVQQVQKLQAAPTAANGTAGTDADDACKELGSGLHTLPLACPKFQLCAGGKAWVLYCPKGKVWDSASQSCIVGACPGASSAAQ